VTHDQVEAMTMADRIVVMRGGVVQQVGDPDEVYSRPANTYVATFVGTRSMNLFGGRIVTDNGASRFEGSFPLVLTPATSPAIPDGDVVLGIRPEDVSLCADDTNGGIAGVVDLAERVGSDTYLDVRLSPESMIVVAVDASAGVREGDRVFLALARDKLSFFGSNGERLEPRAGP
jgi:ABC-type sugar transport system ATPase subunit